MQPIKVLIDDDKWQKANSETSLLLLDIFKNNLLKFHKKRRNFFIKYRVIIRIILIFSIFFLVFSGLYFSAMLFLYEQKFISGISTKFLIALVSVFFFVGLHHIVCYEKFYSRKTGYFHNKIINFSVKNLTKKIFKMPTNEQIPFVRLYELTDDRIICYRYDNDNKVLHWQKTLNELRDFQYYIKDDFCVLYKKSFIRKFMFLWVDSGNKEILETYLKNKGLEPLKLSA